MGKFIQISILLGSILLSLPSFADKPVCPWPDTIPSTLTNDPDIANGLLFNGKGQLYRAQCISKNSQAGGQETGGLFLEGLGAGSYQLDVFHNDGTSSNVQVQLNDAQTHMCLNDIKQLCQVSGFAYPVTEFNLPTQ